MKTQDSGTLTPLPCIFTFPSALVVREAELPDSDLAVPTDDWQWAKQQAMLAGCQAVQKLLPLVAASIARQALTQSCRPPAVASHWTAICCMKVNQVKERGRCK